MKNIPATGAAAAKHYGFDMRKVPGVHCLICMRPIGRQPWECFSVLARFGTMLFNHAKCGKGE